MDKRIKQNKSDKTRVQEHPIMFNSQMVRAILDRHKTQTRRPVKPMKHPYGEWLSVEEVVGEIKAETGAVICPFGRKGDRLWVRETWNMFDPWVGVFYAADDHSCGIGEYDDPDHIEPHNMRWKPSIHMPRWASRITLQITKARVEQLREITAEDAAAEGFAGHDPIAGFADAWNEIYGGSSWADNPWVWVIEFMRVKL